MFGPPGLAPPPGMRPPPGLGFGLVSPLPPGPGDPNYDGYGSTNPEYDDAADGYTYNPNQHAFNNNNSSSVNNSSVNNSSSSISSSSSSSSSSPVPPEQPLQPRPRVSGLMKPRSDGEKFAMLLRMGGKKAKDGAKIPETHGISRERQVRERNITNADGSTVVSRPLCVFRSPSQSHNPSTITPADRVADKKYNAQACLSVVNNKLFCKWCNTTLTLISSSILQHVRSPTHETAGENHVKADDRDVERTTFITQHLLANPSLMQGIFPHACRYSLQTVVCCMCD
jgi:hypothetical protein